MRTQGKRATIISPKRKTTRCQPNPKFRLRRGTCDDDCTKATIDFRNVLLNSDHLGNVPCIHLSSERDCIEC